MSSISMEPTRAPCGIDASARISDDSSVRQTQDANTELPTAAKQPDFPGFTPRLAAPSVNLSEVDFSKCLVALPSPGARLLDLLGDIVDKQRMANNEERMRLAQTTVAAIREQAKEMHNQAVTRLTMGLISSTIQIASSATSVVLGAKALASYGRKPSLLQAHNARIQAISEGIGGVKNVLDTAASFIDMQYEASNKQGDADIEMLRAMRARLDDFNDVLQETLAKATSIQQAIAENMNQTRTHILG